MAVLKKSMHIFLYYSLKFEGGRIDKVKRNAFSWRNICFEVLNVLYMHEVNYKADIF